jgi:hypothetical protein
LNTFSCDRCAKHSVHFCRSYTPEEFIEGDPFSPIWIIGINPAESPDWGDGRSTSALAEGFSKHATTVPYFRDFRAVSPRLFARLGVAGGVAHTDLVKCSSESWPPAGVGGRGANAIVDNCSDYLLQQIRRFRPKLLICNGSAVCEYIRDIIKTSDDTGLATSYVGKIDEQSITVVLSGFIGRIDNHARRRLGREIEELARSLGLEGFGD